MLIDIFSRIERFFWRLESYTSVPPTTAMTGIIVVIMVKVLAILAIVTKEIRQRRSSESIDMHYLYSAQSALERFVKMLLGKNDIEDALKRLDTLIQEEARMAAAEVFKVTHKVEDKMTALIDDATVTFSRILAFLRTGWIRWEISKCEQRKRREAFVV